jgi:hypothetical protein
VVARPAESAVSPADPSDGAGFARELLFFTRNACPRVGSGLGGFAAGRFKPDALLKPLSRRRKFNG